MKSRWQQDIADGFRDDPLALRVYTSRLLGSEPDLVLHGGGNTSVKVQDKDFFGDDVDVLYVKGSGWDLSTIEKAGFAPVKLETLKRLATFQALTDREIVRQQRLALLDPDAPNPSVEAILHAVIPKAYVDHTHADAVVTLTNTPEAQRIIKDVFAERVLVIPYVMPGFTLARTVFAMTQDTSWDAIDGLLLLHHGLFTFSDDAKASYETMLELVTLAEEYLERRTYPSVAAGAVKRVDPIRIAQLRRTVSEVAGKPFVGIFDDEPESAVFSALENIEEVASRGPLTPDHIIQTKRVPLIQAGETAPAIKNDVQAYTQSYKEYFDRHAAAHHTMLDPVPRWIVVKGTGSFYLGKDVKAARIVRDIARHTARAISRAEALGGWRALSEQDLFEMEYWELEQAKLSISKPRLPFAGRVALVSGAASGIGKACSELLVSQGAAVIALDLNAEIQARSNPNLLGLTCDVTHAGAVRTAIETGVKMFGGIDLLIANAGVFPPSQTLDRLEDKEFERSLAVNLDAHRKVLQACLPYLEFGWEPSVVLVVSKNVPAPGPGAAAYSVAKAGLAQLGRIAALELAGKGIRVNMLHPDAVYDTAFWSQEVMQQRAESYGMTVAEYRRKSLLGVEVTSKDVAEAALALASSAFSKTTGAQVAVDGGNVRVI